MQSCTRVRNDLLRRTLHYLFCCQRVRETSGDLITNMGSNGEKSEQTLTQVRYIIT